MALSSKKLYFRYNATNYDLPLFSEKETSCTLSIREGNETLYALADRPEIENIDYTENNIRYFYNPDKPTIHYWQDGYRRNCFNDSENAVVYDIPAGTYTPSAFEALISTFIGYNSSRKVQYAYQVTVNNQTVQCAAGAYIALQKCYKSPYSAQPHAVWFNRRNTTGLATTPPGWYFDISTNGFTNGECYVTYFPSSTLDGYSKYAFPSYAQFNIKVTGGIKFV